MYNWIQFISMQIDSLWIEYLLQWCHSSKRLLRRNQILIQIKTKSKVVQ